MSLLSPVFSLTLDDRGGPAVPAPTYKKLKFGLAANFVTATTQIANAFAGLELDSDPWDFPDLIAQSLSVGTGAGQFNVASKLYHDDTSGDTDYDLTNLLDPKNNAIDFELVKFAIVFNFATTAGHVLTIDPSVTNGWTAPFGGVSASRLIVPPGYLTTSAKVQPGMAILGGGSAAGFLVTPTSKVIRVSAGSNTIKHALFLVGVMV